jgi:hypothetical protein
MIKPAGMSVRNLRICTPAARHSCFDKLSMRFACMPEEGLILSLLKDGARLLDL